MTAPEPERAPDSLENFISIKCVDQQHRELLFKLRMNTKFDRVFARFADEMRLPVHSLRFLFDGDRVSPEQTPGGLVMEDGDTIDVHVEQTGGDGPPSVSVPVPVPGCAGTGKSLDALHIMRMLIEAQAAAAAAADSR